MYIYIRIHFNKLIYDWKTFSRFAHYFFSNSTARDEFVGKEKLEKLPGKANQSSHSVSFERSLERRRTIKAQTKHALIFAAI